MTNYAVFLEGNDFELSRNGSKEALGFFVTVRVESQSEQEAASRAIEIIKADPQLGEALRADTGKNPRIEVKVVHELLPENNMKNTEFVFFPMEEK
jgi:hypothetical protein